MDDFDARTGGDWRESLAGRVDGLVRQFGAGVFLDKWNKYKTDYDAKREELRKWEQERLEHLQKALKNPRWQDRPSGPPSPGWRWHGGGVLLPVPDGPCRRVRCWIPRKLMGDKSPKLAVLLPLLHIDDRPDYRPLKLEEKYIVLTLIHDGFGSHVDRIIPEDAEDTGTKVLFPTKRDVPNKDRECLWQFLEEVKEDLGKQAKPADDGAADSQQPQTATATATSNDEPPKPAVYLTSWREILIALGMHDNAEDKQKVSRLNKSFDGSIISRGQGTQPFVEKTALLKWWAGLEAKVQAQQHRQRSEKATVASRHDYGRDGEVVPGISGEVKRRRQDRQS